MHLATPRVFLFAAIVSLLPDRLMAQPPTGYYDPAAGRYGEDLRAALYGIINGHNVLANSELWSAFSTTDRKPNNTVWDMYSDVPDGTPAYTYQFGTDQCGTYSGEGDCFNREHSFPQSWFNGEPPADTDLFHLYPTDAWANQKRANNAYGEVGSTTWVGSNGSKLGQCTYPGCSGLVFEPIDAYKGDLARSYFYMLVRYLPDLDNWTSPMMSNGEFLPWAESMLLEWHDSDPVSTKELDRNNDVYNIQGNRNPFIDNPQWVSSIWGPWASVDEIVAPIAEVRYTEGLLQVTGLAQGHAAALDLYDATGRSIGQWRISTVNTRLPVELSAGVYMARVSDGDRSSVLRFVP